MSRVCILTDSTAQYPNQLFSGHELVKVIPLHVQLNGKVYQEGSGMRAVDLPISAGNGNAPAAIAPSVDEFRQMFVSLGRNYNEIVVILLSTHLSAAIHNALEAKSTTHSPASIHIIDSQTTTVGLGLLVQAAAKAAHNGASCTSINRLVRGLLPRIYTVFCVESLTYLFQSGHLDPAQGIVGEMLHVIPFFILESGRLVPIQKVRNPRHLVDLVHEFISEFSNLKHISLIHGFPGYENEVRNLRERINVDFPSTSVSEHQLGTALAAIFGPRSLAAVVLEACLETDDG